MHYLNICILSFYFSVLKKIILASETTKVILTYLTITELGNTEFRFRFCLRKYKIYIRCKQTHKCNNIDEVFPQRVSNTPTHTPLRVMAGGRKEGCRGAGSFLDVWHVIRPVPSLRAVTVGSLSAAEQKADWRGSAPLTWIRRLRHQTVSNHFTFSSRRQRLDADASTSLLFVSFLHFNVYVFVSLPPPVSHRLWLMNLKYSLHCCSAAAVTYCPLLAPSSIYIPNVVWQTKWKNDWIICSNNTWWT